MRNVWVRPIRPDDLPTLKTWIEEQRATMAFDPALAAGGQVLVAYDESGPLMFIPFWVSLTAGCPLRRDGTASLEGRDDADALTMAEAFRQAIRGLRFIADAQRVSEINTATNDAETETGLAKCGFAAAGKFMRCRHVERTKPS